MKAKSLNNLIFDVKLIGSQKTEAELEEVERRISFLRKLPIKILASYRPEMKVLLGSQRTSIFPKTGEVNYTYDSEKAGKLQIYNLNSFLRVVSEERKEEYHFYTKSRTTE